MSSSLSTPKRTGGGAASISKRGKKKKSPPSVPAPACASSAAYSFLSSSGTTCTGGGTSSETAAPRHRHRHGHCHPLPIIQQDPLLGRVGVPSTSSPPTSSSSSSCSSDYDEEHEHDSSVVSSGYYFDLSSTAGTIRNSSSEQQRNHFYHYHRPTDHHHEEEESNRRIQQQQQQQQQQQSTTFQQEQHRKQQQGRRRQNNNSKSVILFWLKRKRYYCFLIIVPLGLCLCLMMYTLYSFHSSSQNFYPPHDDSSSYPWKRKRQRRPSGGLNLDHLQQITTNKRNRRSGFGDQVISGEDFGSDMMDASLTKKRSSFRPQHDFTAPVAVDDGDTATSRLKLLQDQRRNRGQQQEPTGVMTQLRAPPRRQQTTQELSYIDRFVLWLDSWGIFPIPKKVKKRLKRKQGREREQDENYLSWKRKEKHAYNNGQSNSSTFDYTRMAIPTAQTLPRPKIYNLTVTINITTNNHSTRAKSTTSTTSLNNGIVIIVLSARGHFALRQAIRETWGQGQALYFVIGGGGIDSDSSNDKNRTENEHESSTNQTIVINANHTTTTTRTSRRTEEQPSTTGTTNTTLINEYDRERQQELLEKEFAEYGDLLDTIHPESYQSLPYKLHFAYHWIFAHYRDDPSWQWILKVDDDILVRSMSRLHDDVLRPLNGFTQPIVVGNIISNSKVNREGKWAEHVYEGRAHYSPNVNEVVNLPFYPFWPMGSCGYVVSRPVAEYLAQHFHPHGRTISNNATNNSAGSGSIDRTTGSPTNQTTPQTTTAVSTSNNTASIATTTTTMTNTSASFPNNNTTNLVYYQGEDTSLGIWLDESPLPVIWIKSRYFVNDKHCPWQNPKKHLRDNKQQQQQQQKQRKQDKSSDLSSTQTALVIGHDWTAQEIRYCYSTLMEEEALQQRLQNGTIMEAAAALHAKDRNLWFVDTHEQRREMDRAYFKKHRGGAPGAGGKQRQQDGVGRKASTSKQTRPAAADYYDTPLMVDDPAFS